MAMANMNLIGVLVTKLWRVQALACGGGDGGDGGGDGGDGGATKNIIPPKFALLNIALHSTIREQQVQTSNHNIYGQV